MRIPSNNCLHHYFSINGTYNRKVMRACGLHTLPDRRTFDRRFKILPAKEIVYSMGERFVSDDLVDVSTVSVDSTMIRAMGRLWHRSSMIQGIVPHSGIDTDARWGFARTKGWIFGYKLHLCCSTRFPVPLSADITTANVDDTKVYTSLMEPLSRVQYVVADMGYDDHKLYDYTRQKGTRLICPIRRYRHTKGARLDLIRFYKSRVGQRIYRKRNVSVEPLFQCIKDAFGISVAHLMGFENVRSYVLVCVLIYQLAVYYNCIMRSENPRCVKYMLGN